MSQKTLAAECAHVRGQLAEANVEIERLNLLLVAKACPQCGKCEGCGGSGIKRYASASYGRCDVCGGNE